MAGRRTKLLAIIGPGILVAATGVGAGDLATGALAGSKLGVALLVLNGRSALVGRRYRNSPPVTLALAATLALSGLAVWFVVQKALLSLS